MQIQQVAFNLLQNAIEAMADRERFALSMSTNLTSDGMIEVSISHSGTRAAAGNTGEGCLSPL